MLEVIPYGEVLQIRMSQVFNGQPLYWVAAYLVDGLLIDSGCRHTAAELAEFLSDHPISQIVHTHYHEDHIGADALLQKTRSLPIYAHTESIPLMKEVPSLFPYQEVVWGYPEPVEAMELGDVVQTPRYKFDVIYTPGHCEGHVSFLEKEQGWCFSGDLFVSEKPKVLRPEEKVGVIMDSLQLLLDNAGQGFTLFTSIGSVVPHGEQALASLLSYLEDKNRVVLDYAAQGMTVEEIRDVVFGGESRMAMVSNGQFSVDNLIKSLLASNQKAI